MTAQERKAKKLNAISVWDRHDPYVGWTYRFWVLVVISFGLNVAWFFQPLLKYLGPQLKLHPEEDPAIIWMCKSTFYRCIAWDGMFRATCSCS